jgi:hypothetical protein
MWITNMTTSICEDITPAATATMGLTPRDAIGKSTKSFNASLTRWISKDYESLMEQNRRILKTRVPESTTWWLRTPAGAISKYAITKSRIDRDRILLVGHDCTHMDMRVIWLELCNFKKRYVYLGDNTLSFNNMEALDLLIRGYSAPTAAKVLHVSVDAYKKRLRKCMEAFGVDSMEALRVKVSESGFIHLLLIPHMPPYNKDLNLGYILQTIDDEEVPNKLP